MAEALRAKIDRWKRVAQYPPNFHAEEDVPTNHFARIVRPMNALQFFTQRNFVADFL